jgi:hypothetical protein
MGEALPPGSRAYFDGKVVFTTELPPTVRNRYQKALDSSAYSEQARLRAAGSAKA